MNKSINFTLKDLEEILETIANNKETNSEERKFKIHFATEAHMKMFDEAMKKEVEKMKNK